MVIDFHTHVFPDALAERAIDALCSGIDNRFTPVTNGKLSSLLSYMDEAGVDISVVMPVVTKPTQNVKTNLWAQSICSDRIISFGGIHHATDDYRRDIDFVVSLGLKGLKFHCEYQGFIVDEPKMLKIYDYALSKGLVLMFHAGFDPGYPPPYKSSAKQMANIADAMRGGVIVAAHLGGYGEWDDVINHLAGKDIYLDTAMGFQFYPEEAFLRVLEALGADRILFGTDSPWSAAVPELEIFRAMDIAEGDKELILSGNAKRLLGI